MVKQWLQFKKWGPWVGSVFVAWLVGHLFDFTTAGVIVVWGKVLTIISFGSVRVRDSVYSKAALNPYVMILPLIAGCVCVGLMVGVWQLMKDAGRRNLTAKMSRAGDLRPQRSDPRLHFRRNLTLRIESVNDFMYVALGVAVAIFVLIMTLIDGQSIDARRVFDADRDIIAPYVDSHELALIQSQFTQVRTKDQYIAVLHKLADIAHAHGVALRSETSAF